MGRFQTAFAASVHAFATSVHALIFTIIFPVVLYCTGCGGVQFSVVLIALDAAVYCGLISGGGPRRRCLDGRREGRQRTAPPD
jgi:hypothetical protein